MKPHVRQTIWLASILGLLVAVDTGSQWIEPEGLSTLPDAPSVKFDALKRIRLVKPDASVEFEHQEDGWQIVSPFNAPADQAAVQDLRRRLHRGLEIELQVEEDSSDLKSFGLEPGLLLEAYTTGDAPDVALYLGQDTSGGATFVRFPDDKSVYRAQLGGRQRYEQPAPAWRDPVVGAFSEDAALSLTLRTSESTLEFNREEPSSPWSLKHEPEFPVDQAEVSTVLRALSGLRAGVVLSPAHPAGLENPIVEVNVKLAEGADLSMSFGRTLAGAFAKNKAKDDIYQIAPSFTERLARPKPAWYNRLLLNFDRAKLHRMSLTEKDTGTTLLEQDPDTNRWTVLQPANVDANLRECMQAAITLSELRAVAMATITEQEAGFPAQNYLEVEMLSGQKVRLELGRGVPGMPKGKEALFVRTSDTPDRIAVLPLRTLIKIRTAFSK